MNLERGADLVRSRLVLNICYKVALAKLMHCLLCLFAKQLGTERASNQLFHLKISQSHMNFRFFAVICEVICLDTRVKEETLQQDFKLRIRHLLSYKSVKIIRLISK